MASTSLTPDKMKATSQGVFEEIWNRKDYGAMEKFMVETLHIVHDGNQVTRTIDETLPAVKAYHRAIPDLTITVDEQIVDLEAGAVVNLLTLRGTHLGSYKGVEATGNEVWQNRVIVHWFNDDGKISRIRSIHSILRGLGHQLENSVLG